MKRLAAVVLALAACHPSPRGVVKPETPAPGVSAVLLRDLAVLATGEAPPLATLEPDAAKLGKLSPAELDTALAARIDALLAEPAFADIVARELVLGEHDHSTNHAVGFLTLNQKAPGKALFLRKPCDDAVAVAVKPWWDPSAEVLVCPDSYQPEHFHNPDVEAYCGGRWLAPGSADPKLTSWCGCGPELAACTRDGKQAALLADSALAEMRATLTDIVGHDKPLKTIFTTNETVRDGWANALYDRAQRLDGKLAAIPDPRAWGPAHAAPRAAPSAGFQAGLLSMPGLLYIRSTERQRMQVYSEALWGTAPVNVRISAEQMLSLHTGDIGNRDGWQKLTQMPVCTNCHARLDYGAQFFLGFPRSDSFSGLVVERVRAGSGPLYINDIRDARGEAPLTPGGYARIAVEQPEFAMNYATRVVGRIFAADAEPADRDAALRAYADKGTLREMMRVVLRRYARRRLSPSSPPAQLVLAAPSIHGDDIAIPKPLREELDRQCIECHEEPGLRDLRGASLPRDRVLAMLGNVAFGAMPKTKRGLSIAERHALVGQILGTLWPQRSDAYAEATRYFTGGDRPLAVLDAVATLRQIDAVRTGPPSAWGLLERSLAPGAALVTPGFSATLALEALRACKEVAKAPPGVKDCMVHAGADLPLGNSIQ